MLGDNLVTGDVRAKHQKGRAYLFRDEIGADQCR